MAFTKNNEPVSISVTNVNEYSKKNENLRLADLASIYEKSINKGIKFFGEIESIDKQKITQKYVEIRGIFKKLLDVTKKCIPKDSRLKSLHALAEQVEDMKFKGIDGSLEVLQKNVKSMNQLCWKRDDIQDLIYKMYPAHTKKPKVEEEKEVIDEQPIDQQGKERLLEEFTTRHKIAESLVLQKLEAERLSMLMKLESMQEKLSRITKKKLLYICLPALKQYFQDIKEMVAERDPRPKFGHSDRYDQTNFRDLLYDTLDLSQRASVDQILYKWGYDRLLDWKDVYDLENCEKYLEKFIQRAFIKGFCNVRRCARFLAMWCNVKQDTLCEILNVPWELYMKGVGVRWNSEANIEWWKENGKKYWEDLHKHTNTPMTETSESLERLVQLYGTFLCMKNPALRDEEILGVQNFDDCARIILASHGPEGDQTNMIRSRLVELVDLIRSPKPTRSQLRACVNRKPELPMGYKQTLLKAIEKYTTGKKYDIELTPDDMLMQKAVRSDTNTLMRCFETRIKRKNTWTMEDYYVVDTLCERLLAQISEKRAPLIKDRAIVFSVQLRCGIILSQIKKFDSTVLELYERVKKVYEKFGGKQGSVCVPKNCDESVDVLICVNALADVMGVLELLAGRLSSLCGEIIISIDHPERKQ